MNNIQTSAPFHSLVDFQQLLITQQNQGNDMIRFHCMNRWVATFSFHNSVSPVTVSFNVRVKKQEIYQYLRRMHIEWHPISSRLQTVVDHLNEVTYSAAIDRMSNKIMVIEPNIETKVDVYNLLSTWDYRTDSDTGYGNYVRITRPGKSNKWKVRIDNVESRVRVEYHIPSTSIIDEAMRVIRPSHTPIELGLEQIEWHYPSILRYQRLQALLQQRISI